MAGKDVDQFIESLPTVDEIKRRISENESERSLLRQMLRLSQQRQAAGKAPKLEAAGACG
jgi:hypothetical protein